MNTEDLELIHANISKTIAETMKLGAETMKLSAETAKIQKEQRYYPMIALGAIIVSALGTGAVVVAKLL